MQVTSDADESCFEGVVGTVPCERTGTEVASRQITVSWSRAVRMSRQLEKDLGGRVHLSSSLVMGSITACFMLSGSFLEKRAR